MLSEFSRRWWIVGLRGVLALVFGILAFVFPSAALMALVLVFGIYALLDGLFALTTALALRPQKPLWTMLLIEGIAGILAGIFAFAWPEMTAFALVYLAAAWALVTGIFQLVAAYRLREIVANDWLMIVGGAASILLGVLLIALPGAAMFVWVMLVAAYAVVFGVVTISLAVKLYRLSHGPTSPPLPTGAHPA